MATTDVVQHGPDGVSRRFPLTADFAIADLHLFRRHLASLFPMSAEQYPADSLSTLVTARASAWLHRLQTTPDADIRGRQQLAFARVAADAEQDSLAETLYEARLAEVRGGGAQGPRTALAQSVVLADAVATFADTDQRPDRLARNLVRADRYVTQLLSLPAAGYATQSDSTDILYRQYSGMRSLVMAADAIQQPERIVHYGFRLLAILPQLAHGERVQALLQFPYREVAIALLASSSGRPRLDSLNKRLLDVLVPGAAEWPPDPQGISREILIRNWQSGVQATIASFALLGQPAPPIEAHAWLNTPDSSYVAAPITRSFADGKIRVIAFGGLSTSILNSLDRVHRSFAGAVDVILVTSTLGHIGPDIATPADECAWLQQYYGMRRGLVLPIAVWAGEKVPGAYGASQPSPSPVGARYYAGVLRSTVVLVDGAGIVRAYHPLGTRTQEASLVRRLESLLSSQALSVIPANAAIQ